MIRFEEALGLIEKLARERGAQLAARPPVELRLDKAVGRVLAEDIVSASDVPGFANSAMDGFAVRAETTRDASPDFPVRLAVAGIIPAGDLPPTEPADCWEIMTGAHIPDGFDAVVKIEDTRIADGLVVITRPIPSGENIRPAGEDFRRGERVVEAGTRLTSEHVLALAGLGRSTVKVRPRPKVCILSTGAELVPLTWEHPLRPGQIYNSTSPYLLTALAALNVDAESFGVVRDEPREFLSALDAILAEDPDLILTTGAVSMGKYDFIATALRDRQARISFHKVAIRPGKPLLFAELPGEGGKPGPAFFGLPGNPISTVVGLRFFVKRYLHRLNGTTPAEPWRLPLEAEVKKPEALRCFFKARVNRSRLTVKVLSGQSSALVRPLVEADAWAVLPDGRGSCAAGEVIEVYPL